MRMLLLVIIVHHVLIRPSLTLRPHAVVSVQVDRDLAVVRDLELRLVAVINTHVHADHITGTGILKARAEGIAAKSGISAASDAAADVKFAHGDSVAFGKRRLNVRATPGHTAGCLSYVLDDESMVFTGDALLIRGCGRTDFQQGSAETLYSSVHTQLFTLPEGCFVYPGHDYLGRTRSTVGEEKALNPRLTQPLTGFVATMKGLNLAYPKKLDVAFPANMRCGVPDVAEAKVAEAKERGCAVVDAD